MDQSRGDRTVCETCLSTDRRLAPLGSLLCVYVTLMGCDPRTDPSACWECTALLRRAAQFRLRAAHAQSWLHAKRLSGRETLQDMKPSSSLIATEPNAMTHALSADSYLFIDLFPCISKEEDDAEDSSGFDNVHQFIDTENDEETKMENKLFNQILPENASDRCIEKNRTKGIELRVKKQPKNARTGHCNLSDTENIRFKNALLPQKAVSENKSLETMENPTLLVTAAKNISQNFNKGKAMKRGGRGGGRPRSSVSILKLNEEDVWSYRKEELEQDWFRMAKYKCETCVLVLRKSDYAAHMKIAHGKETWQWKCYICGVRLSTKSSLDRHEEEHYKLFGCCRCNFKCLNMHRMEHHIYSMHYHPKKYQCSTCNMNFNENVELKHHLKEHKKIDNHYECDKCTKTFKTSLKIIKHLESHELHKCTVCDYAAKSKNNLAYHFQRKHDIAPVLSEVYCVECNKQFYTAFSYEDHLARAHRPKTNKIVPCPECNKTFRDEYNLKCHDALFHLKKTKYHCEKCNKYFCGSSGLRGHMQNIHYGLKMPKKYACNICGRGFSTNRILINHIRTHTGERPYKCQFCDAAFAQKTAMKSHEKNVHHRVIDNRKTKV